MTRAGLHSVWYGGREPGPVLGALATAYGCVFRAHRRWALAHRRTDLERWPIVVVGNLTAGGAGKTPLVMRICELAEAAGLRPGVVSRGYGRRSRGLKRVTAASSAFEVGDEPLLIARRCGVPVVVDANRENAVRELAGLGVDLVISDDGLQRWRMPRDIEICVMDAALGFGNGLLLPAGPLREPMSRLTSVDYLISNGGEPQTEAGRAAIAMHLRPKDFSAVGRPAFRSVEEMAASARGQRVHAVAGIAFPERFFDSLTGLGLHVDERHAFADHHRFRRRDLVGLEGLVIMTEKDAVKCERLDLRDTWALRVEARLPAAWERELQERLHGLLERRRP